MQKLLIAASMCGLFVRVAAAAVHYVDLNSSNPVSPFISWATAATNIQHAVDVAAAADEILVNDGVYRSGGRMAGGFTNRLVVTNTIIIQSVSGPDLTLIEGAQPISGGNGTDSVRCVYLGAAAVLTGFTVTNGGVRSILGGPPPKGGGVFGSTISATLSNCVLVGNSAGEGGGACGVTLQNCMLSYNQARLNSGLASGAGASECILTNCTLAGNSASYVGGGASSCTLAGCSVTGNYGAVGAGGAIACKLYDCTITENWTPSGAGGGIGSCPVVINCLLANNYAANAASGGASSGSYLTNCVLLNNSAQFGGGAAGGLLFACTLGGNSAVQNGGAAQGAALINCTITNNTAEFGGGTMSCFVTNCAFSGNTAGSDGGGSYMGTLQSCTIYSNTAYYGGGASAGRLFNCMIISNIAWAVGGGAADASLNSCLIISNSAPSGGGVSETQPDHTFINNCTIVGNSADNAGGGVQASTIRNSIIYYNSAPTDPNWTQNTNASFNCTMPLPPSGSGNITNEPMFVNLASGNFDLQSVSPCVDEGSNAYVTNTVDFLGRPRISGGGVDMGAYEYQSLDPFHFWLKQYGLPFDGSADLADPDQDGMNNWQEWIAGTIPTNAVSVLRIQTVVPIAQSKQVQITWASVTNRSYFLQRSTNLSAFITIQTNLAGQANSTTSADTNVPPGSAAFYRIGVHQ